MKQNLDREVKARISPAMYKELEAMLEREEDGIKISNLVRRAIRLYLDSQNPRKVRAAKTRADEESAV